MLFENLLLRDDDGEDDEKSTMLGRAFHPPGTLLHKRVIVSHLSYERRVPEHEKKGSPNSPRERE